MQEQPLSRARSNQGCRCSAFVLQRSIMTLLPSVRPNRAAFSVFAFEPSTSWQHRCHLRAALRLLSPTPPALAPPPSLPLALSSRSANVLFPAPGRPHKTSRSCSVSLMGSLRAELLAAAAPAARAGSFGSHAG